MNRNGGKFKKKSIFFKLSICFVEMSEFPCDKYCSIFAEFACSHVLYGCLYLDVYIFIHLYIIYILYIIYMIYHDCSETRIRIWICWIFGCLFAVFIFVCRVSWMASSIRHLESTVCSEVLQSTFVFADTSPFCIAPS